MTPLSLFFVLFFGLSVIGGIEGIVGRRVMNVAFTIVLAGWLLLSWPASALSGPIPAGLSLLWYTLAGIGGMVLGIMSGGALESQIAVNGEPLVVAYVNGNWMPLVGPADSDR